MELENINKKINKKFKALDSAREYAFALHREIIKISSLAIRATHRREFAHAQNLITSAKKKNEELKKNLKKTPEIYYAGFVHDSQKEYAEAQITFALIAGKPIPDHDNLKIDCAAYLNGMGEAVGELRRFILDSLRLSQDTPCENLLSTMDEIYYLLTSVDYPDAITKGLRRTTDIARSLLERTRGDLTTYLTQKKLETALTVSKQKR